MEQVTFADVEYEGKKRRTRRELFLERMEALIPWERLEARIRPLYPKAGRGAAAVPVGGDAEDSLRAAVLQPERPGDGGHAVRDRVGAAVRGAAFDGSAAGRDDDSELSAPAGAARAGAWFVRGDQRAPGRAGLPGAGGDDRGREHHRGAVIDEEPGGGAGSGDASDEEGQRVALRG